MSPLPLGRWIKRPTKQPGVSVVGFEPDPVSPEAAKAAEDAAIASFEAQLTPGARLPMSAPQSVFSAHPDPQRFPGL